IGLFRSEYLLGRSREWPAENRQLEVYRRLVELMRPHPVTVRTWDVGPEDLAPGGPTSPNPALGERSLRRLRRAPEAFRGQRPAGLRPLPAAPSRGAPRDTRGRVGGPGRGAPGLHLRRDGGGAGDRPRPRRPRGARAVDEPRRHTPREGRAPGRLDRPPRGSGRRLPRPADRGGDRGPPARGAGRRARRPPAVSGRIAAHARDSA